MNKVHLNKGVHEYAFDVTMTAVIRVDAQSIDEAIRKLDSLEAVDMETLPAGVRVTEFTVHPALVTDVFEWTCGACEQLWDLDNDDPLPERCDCGAKP